MNRAGGLVAAGLGLAFLIAFFGASSADTPPRPEIPSRYREGGPCVQVQQALWLAGWEARLIPTVVEIARLESGCQMEATRKTAKEHSVGPLQINLMAHPDVSEDCARDYGCAAEAALEIYRVQGLVAWTVYRNGFHRY
jgi:hypothetical protein